MNKKKEETKLTKAQLKKLEKERKAEEERKRLEDEAQKLAEVQRIAAELAAKRKAEKEAYRTAEKERLSTEEKSFYPIQMELRKKKEALTKANEEEEAWAKYLDCSNEYDISKEADLNLMLVLIDELPLLTDKDLDLLLKRLDTAEEIIVGLERYILLTKSRGKPVKTFKSFIESFGAMISRKFEQICNYISQNSEYIVQDKLEEMKQSDKMKTVKPADMKPEVYLSYPKTHSQLAFFIQGFENSGIKTKPIDFSDFSVMSDMPKAFFSKKLIMVAKKYCREYFAFGSLEHDNPHLRLIDGVVDVECIAYLPETKQIKNYRLKRVYSPGDKLERLTYTTMEGSSSNYKVYICLPKQSVIVPRDNLEVRYWANGKWTSEGIGEVAKEYNKDIDKAFYAVPLPRMAPVALLINKFAELPFKQFKLRRTGDTKVLLSLITQRVELKIEIMPYKVKLVFTSQQKVEPLLDIDFKPSELLYELQRLNILLLNDHTITSKPKDVSTKDPDLARNVLREISKACLLYHVQSSRWNPMSKPKDYVLRIRENPELDEDFYEDTPIDWRTVQFKPESVKLLCLIENSESFSKARKAGTVSHLNLYSLVNEYPQYFVQNYLTESFNDDEVRMITTIEDLLGMIQLFNFVV